MGHPNTRMAAGRALVRHLRAARGIASLRAGASGAFARLSPPPAHAQWTAPRQNDSHDHLACFAGHGSGVSRARGFSAGPSEKKGDDGAGEGDDVEVDAHPAEPEAKPEVTVMRPSVWIIPSLIYRALRARLDMWWVRVMVDPHFDEREFLTGAIGAHEVVLKNFAANDMRALGAMLTERALAAFRDAFIEADRGNVALDVDVERNENPIIVELSLRVNDDVTDARAEETLRGLTESLAENLRGLAVSREILLLLGLGSLPGLIRGERGSEGDGGSVEKFGWDAGEDDMLKLRVGVRFNSRELWTMTDKVSGRKSYSVDLRGHTFYFGRALPRFLPSLAPLTSPWMLEDIK